MKLLTQVGMIFTIFAASQGKTYIIFQDRLKECTPQNQNVYVLDYSNFYMIPENDTHTFLNGSIRVNKPITAPWNLRAYTEFYERGQWNVRAYDHTFLDFCKDFKNPTAPWYYITKTFKECPIPAGYEFKLDMVPLEFSETFKTLIPSHYMGQWRCVINGTFEENGKKLLECKMGFADVFVE